MIARPLSRVALGGLALAGALLAAAGAAPAQEAGLQRQAETMLREFLRGSKARAGLCAVELPSGRLLLAAHAEETFAPASNQKLLTSAFALGRLGADFQFVTAACAVGEDLWVLGSGDPTFGDAVMAAEANRSIYAEMDRWAAAIRAAMPGGVGGDLIVCGAFGANQKRPQESFRQADWPKDQYHLWYAAPAAAVNFNDNCLDVSFRLAGGKVRPAIVPGSRLIQVVNRIAVGGRQLWSVRLSQADSVVSFSGSARASASEPISVPVNDPLLLFGRVLAERLARAGVRLAGDVRTSMTPPPGVQSLAVLCHRSAGLPEVLRRANKHSLNLAAECVFLRAGDGTWSGSAALAAECLTRQFGLEANQLAVRDGGGLSRLDRVSPRALATLLAGLARRDDATVLLASLPVSGADGTLARRMREPPYRLRVRAKTGYIAGVSCLSGYILDRQGRPAVALSVLVNDMPGSQLAASRKLQDDLARRLVDWCDR